MNARERVLAALAHEDPGKVPRYTSFTPVVMERFQRETGSDDPDDFFDHEVRDVDLNPTRLNTDFSRFHQDAPDNIRITEWGIGEVPGTFYHFWDYAEPMKSFTSVREVEEYPWPDLEADYRYNGLKERVESWHDRGYAVRGASGPVFETSWFLRGMEQAMMEMLAGDEITTCILDRVEHMCRVRARRMAEADVDILLTSDDVGTQRGMMISEKLWRAELKPRLGRIIQAAKDVKPDIHVFYHSDGNVEAIVPELMEVGVDILNPVQPECMDPVHLKERYGERLSFWGTIGIQTTLPYGTPADEIGRAHV